MELNLKNIIKFFFTGKNKVISWTIVSIIISFFVIRFIFISLADIDPFEYFRF